MTEETLARANKLATDIESLKQVTSQIEECLTITHGSVTKTFRGDTKDDIILHLFELLNVRKERLEKL